MTATDSSVLIRHAEPTDLTELAALATLTFPLAAPPHVTEESLATFIDQHLSADRLSDYLDDPGRVVSVAVGDSGALIGYTLLVFEQPRDADVAAVVTFSPAVELSKVYAHPDAHGSGVAHLLVQAAFSEAEQRDVEGIWLGVNQENLRAQRFYEKSGFTRVGTKRFQVGAGLEHDFVYARPISPPAR